MTSEAVRMPGVWHVEYNYTIGKSAVEFFRALREKQLVGCNCERCGRTFVPPKGFCEFCFQEIGKMVNVGDKGEIEAVTIVTAPFKGSPPTPYCVAYVRLDGATSAVANYVRGVDLGEGSVLPDRVAIGQRVRVVFDDVPKGRITDFWFEPE